MKTYMKDLYCMMHDDLKDADELVHYAKDICTHDKDWCKFFVQEAKERLNHFKNIHKKFMDLGEEHKKTMPAEMMMNTCWEVSHEHMMEWHSKIELMIKHLEM